MKLLNEVIERKIEKGIIDAVARGEFGAANAGISEVLDDLYRAIPDNKRISYGRVHTVKVLSDYLYARLIVQGAPVYEIARAIFEQGDDYKAVGVGLGMLASYGLGDYEKVLPYFITAAASEHWDVREFAQMFFRKLIKRYPDEMKQFLLEQVRSGDANIRRFVSETLRPVQENRWFAKDPEYPISVLRALFTEGAAYPRTSVGNNLSDLARQQPELVYSIVEELVNSGDKNSYWIAYRACRNLVKKEPIRVMDLIKVDEYKYKERVYRRRDHNGS